MFKIISLVTTNNLIKQFQPKTIFKANNIIHRNSSYRSSNVVRDVEEYPEVETISDSSKWKYVEILFKPKIVPLPKIKSEYPSGWTPVKADPSTTKYYINRTKNYMIPVYLKVSFRGQRRLTQIRKIEGDIWTLEKELRNHIESNRGKICATRINELCGQITIHGDHLALVKNFLISKGF